MANPNRPPYQQDPFSDRPQPPRPAFYEPHLTTGGPGQPSSHGPSPYSSTVSLPQTAQTVPATEDQYLKAEEYEEKTPLTGGHGFPGQDYYPPSNIDPSAYGIPSTTGSIYSTNTQGAESAWRRRQTIKRGETRRVKLTSGNFISEYHVPTPILNAIEPRYKNTNTTEFTHMRYSAITCDPDDFTVANGWSLRTALYKRETELLIAVTSYNENKALYSRTLHGVMLNIRDICKTKQSKFWKRSAEEGQPGWQRITVALIVDGLEPMDKSVLDLLASVGVYQDGVMKKEIDEKPTVAHMFEYTTQLSLDGTPRLVVPEGDDPNNLVPVQIILIIKAKNEKKINSHRWLFNAIGKMLNPEICVLLDAGTKPGHKAIYYLWEAFYNDPNLGGCCGEIHAMIKAGKKLLNPLVAAQNFEYKMSNILDKPLESSFGYVSVLPGAFSAYRYRAILGRPLEQYFHGDHSLAARLGKKGIYGMNIFTKNMFLAEDRILCFELVAKEGDQWTLTYVKPSKAETDVPEGSAELIGQRRRWLNGSFAASVYSIVNFFRLYKSGHGIIRMFFFHIQALYNIFLLLFSWFALANVWLTFSIIIDILPTQGIIIFGTADVTHWVNLGLKWLYLAFLLLQFILGLGNRPKGERSAYLLTLWVFAILSLYLIICSFILTGKSFAAIPDLIKQAKTPGQIVATFFKPPVGSLIAAMISTFGIYLIASLLYGDPWHMLSSFPQYMLLAVSFTNVLNVYAFCNLHDVSWGTKGSDTVDALPSVSSSKSNKNEVAVVEDTAKKQEDLDAAFKETVTRAYQKVSTKEIAEKPTLDDQNKTFRTRLVALWMLSNATLAIAIENIDGRPSGSLQQQQADLAQKQSVYFSIILYSTFGLAAVRFIGCIYYLINRNLFRCCRRN